MIDAQLIKVLRRATGAGLADCRKALQEKEGDLETAKEWLHARGAAIAQKKSVRNTQEGAIGICHNDQKAAIVEVLAETDFVANNEVFRSFTQQVADAILQAGPEGCAAPAQVNLNGKTLEELRIDATLKVRENIQLGRCKFLHCQSQLFYYLHHNAKVGAIADISCADNPSIGKQLCMHIAAQKPKGLIAEDLNSDELSGQRQAFIDAVNQTNKPNEVKEKIIAGKMNKFISEHALLQQAYVWEDNVTVSEYLDQHKASIASFAWLAIGE